jgi:hypothetical protein
MTVPQLRGRLIAIERNASRRGWTPDVQVAGVIGTGYHASGLSTYGKYDDLGNFTPTGGWVKSAADKDSRLVTLLDAIQETIEPIRGLVLPTDAPEFVADDMLSVYPIGDLHLGMYAWADETGEAFDLALCEKLITDAMRRVVAKAPPAKKCLLVNLGDWFHSDNPSNRTARSGHALDVDTRWGKVYAMGIKIQRMLTQLALKKHEFVHWENLIGNHDDVTSQTLSHSMALLYENEPRVSVSISPAQHRFHEFGSVLLGFHHGHETKTAALQGVMAVDQREAWGRTRWRHWYCGHVHHERVREASGCTIEYFRTTSPKDMWACGAGYRSDRDLRCDTWHVRDGLDSRHVVRALTPPA